MAAVAALGWSLAAGPAARPGGAQEIALAAVRSLDCAFTLKAAGTWTADAPEATLEASTLSLRFESIDAHEATADVIGPFGPSHVVSRLTGDYLHFLQMFNAGPLYATTVFGRETADGKLMAVHTRHEYTDVSLVGFTSRSEQYYGACAAGR